MPILGIVDGVRPIVETVDMVRPIVGDTLLVEAAGCAVEAAGWYWGEGLAV